MRRKIRTKTCKKYAALQKYTNNMQIICKKYAKKYAKNMQNICKKYAKNMTPTRLRLLKQTPNFA